MRRITSVSFIFLLLGLSFVFGGCSQKAQPVNIIAEFEGQVVTLDEFQKEVSELSEREKRKYEGKAGLEEYLTLMAESRMLLEFAKEKGLDRDPAMVKQVEDYKDQLLVKELVKREVDDKVTVTDVHLEMYYQGHKADYVEPEKIVVTEITLKDEEKAKEVMEKIKGGVDFTELAKEMDAKGETSGPGQGNGGKTTPFSRDSFRNAQDFVEAAFSLEIGQMSDIIVQPLGNDTYYMIVRLDERIPPRQQEFSEVESRIRRIVEKEKKKERMDAWLQAIKVQKKFQLYPDRIPEPTEAEGAVEKTEGAVEKTEEVLEKTEEAIETEDEQKTPDKPSEEEK